MTTTPQTPAAAPQAAAAVPDSQKGLTKSVEKSLGLIWGITKGIAKRVRAVGTGIWYGTLGQIPAEFKYAGEKLGLPAAKEKGPLSAIASIMGSVRRGISKVLKGMGSLIAEVGTAPIRIGERVLRATEGTVAGLFTGKSPEAPDISGPTSGGAATAH